MKRLLCLTIAALLLFTGCSKKTDWTTLQIASAIAEAQDHELELKSVLPGDESYEHIIGDYYGLSFEDISDGAILFEGGISGFEIAVLKLADKVDVKKLQSDLERYISARSADFTGYFPEEEAMVRNSIAVVKNGYALLLICSDTYLAKETFDKCFKDLVPSSVPDYKSADEGSSHGDGDTESDPGWSYDHDRLVEAWEKENWYGLSIKDRKILEACFDILQEVKRSGQTLPELELAVHDWMVDYMSYDTATLENYGGVPDPDNDNPYGALINGNGICEGYTRSFQLLMDLAGIECISVYGNSDNGVEYGEHAWNQVCFDGDWYIVDVTWDDPLSRGVLPEKYHHRYFNVTADDIRENHFWDEDAVPEANGTVYTWDSLRMQ